MALDDRAWFAGMHALDSLRIDEGDRLLIQGETAFKEHGDLIAQDARVRGATVTDEYTDPSHLKQMIVRGDKDELSAEGARLCGIADSIDARIFLDATSDPTALANIPQERINAYEEIVRGPFLSRIWGDAHHSGKRVTVLAVPSVADATFAGMEFREYETMLYDSILSVDRYELMERMVRLKRVLDGTNELRVRVPGMTDLSVSLRGRGAKLCTGEVNLPDGEFYFGPVEGSVRGTITFPYVSVWEGKAFERIKLVFARGRADIGHCTAATNSDALQSILRMPGANVPGEIGFGCNQAITTYCRNTLLDEKIAGTIHLAMGNSFNEPVAHGGGYNRSSIHWDLVCDLRKMNGLPGGTITADGKLVQKDGFWLI